MLIHFSIYKLWGFQNKPLSIIKYLLLEQVALSNHRNPPRALFWCYQLLALFATARPCKSSLKSNKACEPTRLWLGLQSEGFVCSWSPLSSCISKLWVIRNTCSFPLLQTHMHRFWLTKAVCSAVKHRQAHCYQAFAAPRLKIFNLLNVALVMGLFFLWTPGPQGILFLWTLQGNKNFLKSF